MVGFAPERCSHDQEAQPHATGPVTPGAPEQVHAGRPRRGQKLPAGTERHTLLQKARNGEAAAEIERLLSSPGPQHQK